MKHIPLYKPLITKEDIDAVAKSLRTGHLTRYRVTERFESKFAEFVGRKYAVAVNSGTAALMLAVKAHGWGQGDKVITSPFSYIATTNSLLYSDVTPLFFDIEKRTYNLDFQLTIKEALSGVKGIMLPHVFGATADLESFRNVVQNHPDLVVIEDACEALVPRSSNLPVGRFSKTSVYSFHENKTVVSGEGGIIATDDPSVYEACISLRDQGRSDREDWLAHTRLGFNFRITEMQAALAGSQLSRHKETSDNLKRVAERYCLNLDDCKGIELPISLPSRAWVFFYITTANRSLRKILKFRLSQKGVATADHYFTPIYKFGHVRKTLGSSPDQLPITEDIASRILVLPFYQLMTNSEVDYVCESIRSIVEEAR